MKQSDNNLVMCNTECDKPCVGHGWAHEPSDECTLPCSRKTTMSCVPVGEYLGPVVITKERYDSLIESEEFLDKLKAAGVDNWEGYDIAMGGY